MAGRPLGQDELHAGEILLALANDARVVEAVGEVFELVLEEFAGQRALELGEVFGGAVAQVPGFHFTKLLE